ncbi:MFS transporter [Desulfospira joergensenii]|uniref:MFS transporter n=1 Tax=Desulfospira joergensenii TaxID=53329 RepID=UPI0003B76145|nr:MFS transporter [Desulfospira joergensenii]
MTDTSHIDNRQRIWIIGATLMALFLGAMDALVITAAMPSIISDLGGLDLYAWVYSAYFLARAVSLPVFGKLADLYDTRKLFLVSISLFLLASAAAGASPSMAFLVAARVVQGIGAGGNFALVYIVLSDVALPGRRARTLSLASSIWGISSVIGPSLGGFIVTWFSWRWIFYINVPLGIVSLFVIGIYLREFRKKNPETRLDLVGACLLTGFILSLLTLFISGGRTHAWGSTWSLSMAILALGLGIGFIFAEHRAADPILNPNFFKSRLFSLGNGAAFFASFAIFALFAYSPLFVQGALSRTPMETGLAMLSLSLGWSMGSLVLGRVMHRFSEKPAALAGGAMLVTGGLMTLGFTPNTTMTTCFLVFLIMGLGMGFVTLSTLLLVQGSLSDKDLGVSTSSHQFFRTLGGTIGVGVCGGLVTTGLVNRLDSAVQSLPPQLFLQLKQSTENLFKPEFQALLTPDSRAVLEEAVAGGLGSAFWVVAAASILCLVLAAALPAGEKRDSLEN